MINRIRDVRKQKRMTLADVALRCAPPTTPQTIGRLETGMRNLSLDWMNRIAAALGVAPEVLVRSNGEEDTKLIARLTDTGAEPLSQPMDALLPSALAGDRPLLAMAVEAGAGDYRNGDQIWLRRIEAGDYLRALNRDVLAPRPAGRFAFGRMIDARGTRIALLPPGAGQRQIVLDNPAWLAVAEMLVRRL